ncbi:MAG: SRPBCC domain-containing protein [Gemmatimonadetes bacterium]|nr:SRPBCC domain-containing protein [Gemmatimonadota bacterium]
MLAEKSLEIRFKTWVNAEPARVWDALATAEGLDGWFTHGASVSAKPQGHIYFRWRDWGPDRLNSEARGEVLEAQNPSRLVFQWTPVSAEPDCATTIEFDLEGRGGGTVIHFREHGYPMTPPGLRAYRAGAVSWGEALTLLKFWVEHGLRVTPPPRTKPRRRVSH